MSLFEQWKWEHRQVICLSLVNTWRRKVFFKNQLFISFTEKWQYALLHSSMDLFINNTGNLPEAGLEEWKDCQIVIDYKLFKAQLEAWQLAKSFICYDTVGKEYVADIHNDDFPEITKRSFFGSIKKRLYRKKN